MHEFIEDMVEPSVEKSFVKCKELREAFYTWGYENNRDNCKITNFNNEVIKVLKAKYAVKEGKVGGIRGVYGISLKKIGQNPITDIRKYRNRA